MNRLTLVSTVAFFLTGAAAAADLRAHGRPHFMPPHERDRLRTLVATAPWAEAEHAQLQTAAEKGDGHAAAFLYALDGDARYLPAARRWLLEKWGPQSYWIQRANERLAEGAFFKGGQPGIPEVYYDTDVTGLVGFDWVAAGLNDADRKTIADGIITWARYKMRCMDRWTQTPNLVFKPTCTVALSGLATDSRELLDWGFRRTRPWGGGLGGYDVVMESMLLDGGPWREAPIYPVAHEVMALASKVSWYRGLADRQDWFNHKTAEGSSLRGLADYYLDSAYPIERTGAGPGQVRVATYGDGSTNGGGDLFLANPAGAGLNMTEALSAAYNASGDPRYAAFLALNGTYRPSLIDRRPLPDRPALPPAPSKVWPHYGLAMLRSDESPGYWNNENAIAVFQVMSQGYGHDHRDKFAIMLHGANRLFYPEYNAIQYENPAIGWTRNSVSHNTLIVDEQETRDASPTGIRHDFTPDVKFLATSASGVFEGVDQTRALLLTREYLLDLFHAASEVPHNYDYALHSFGKAQPLAPERYKPSEALKKRYWLVENQQSMRAKDSWALDFVIKEEPGGRKGYGKPWYDHTARLRVTMAAAPDTLVTHGVWGEELAKLVGECAKGSRLDRLAAVITRRSGVRDTVFAAVHEPYANDQKPRVQAVTVLARTAEAIAVRVDAAEFTDYIAIAFGPQKENAEHHLAGPPEKPDAAFSFKNFGYVRVNRAGEATARGGWTALRLPGLKGAVALNGKPVAGVQAQPPVPRKPDPECPLSIAVHPAVARLFNRDRRTMTFAIKNPLKEAVSGSIEFQTPAGLTVEPARPEFGPVAPGATADVKVTFVSNNPAPGRHTVPYRVNYRTSSASGIIRSAALPVVAMIGPTLEYVYEHPRPTFRVYSSKYTTRMDMFDGLCRYLADDDDVARLDGTPLFTLGDGKETLLDEHTRHAFTWPREAPAQLVAHAYDRCRWQALYFGDRILFRMDPGWTQFEKAYFTIPGKWISPGGPPVWKRVVAVDGAGKEMDVQPGPAVKVSAAELAFPGGKWSLAFKFEPPQEVAFEGTKMSFHIGGVNNDGWQVGFCPAGKLDAWRGKR